MFLKKTERLGIRIILLLGGLLPLAIFLNRFLIPDFSFDSINYHVYLGYKMVDFSGIKNFEFYPTGIHNFWGILELPGYLLMSLLGYRLGSVGSLLALYAMVYVVYRMVMLENTKKKLWSIISVLLFINVFISLEMYFQLATYFVDIVSAVGVLGSICLLLKGKERWSLGLMGVMMASKMTNLIYLPGYLWLFLRMRKAMKGWGWLEFVWLVLPLIIFWGKNLLFTGNPLFPFYNGIFESKYFPTVNFAEGRFGGRDLVEKIGYFWFSYINPERLGEGHDLFNDFKLNIYFGVVLFSLTYLALIKKTKGIFFKLSLFWMLSYAVWCFTFGYLRYAMVLEILGGVLLLFLYLELKEKQIFWWGFLPLFFILFWQNKRVINNGLAYDLSWRPGYYYNSWSYGENWKDLFKSRIDTGEIKADVYVNCAVPNLGYYVLSDFFGLPVVNIDSNAYGQMTGNEEYRQEVKSRLKKLFGEKRLLRFVTIATEKGLNEQVDKCRENLMQRGWKIESERELGGFLGYEKQELMLVEGDFDILDL